MAILGAGAGGTVAKKPGEDTSMPMLAGMAGQVPLTAGSGGAAPPAGMMQVSSTPSLGSPVDATDASYARAKDEVGNSSAGLLKALQNAMSSRGLSGSSAETAAVGNTLLGSAGQLADVSRENAAKRADVANDFAKEQYEGGINMRGQDLNLLESRESNALGARGQDVTMRGQDITRTLGRDANSLTARGQDITQRGQDLDAQARAQALQYSANGGMNSLPSILGLWSAFQNGVTRY